MNTPKWPNNFRFRQIWSHWDHLGDIYFSLLDVNDVSVGVCVRLRYHVCFDNVLTLDLILNWTSLNLNCNLPLSSKMIKRLMKLVLLFYFSAGPSMHI